MFPMPRVLYCMASDGLVFEFFSYLMPKLKTPYLAAIGTGLLAGILILIFDLNQLIDMMSIGTLIAYTLVAASTLILRYRPLDPPDELGALKNDTALSEATEQSKQRPRKKVIKRMVDVVFGESNEPLLRRLFRPSSKEANRATSHLVNVTTGFAGINMFVLCAIFNLAPMETTAFVFIGITLFNIIVLSIIIFMQPNINAQITTFKVRNFQN
jgi:amino acid transporter